MMHKGFAKIGFHLAIIAGMFFWAVYGIALAETFDFTANTTGDTVFGPSGGDSTSASQTVGGYTLNLTATTGNVLVVDGSTYYGYAPTNFSGNIFAVDGTWNTTSSITLSVSGGYLFDLTGLTVQDQFLIGLTLILTTGKGTVNVPVTPGSEGDIIPLSDANIQGVSSITITKQGGGTFLVSFDNITLANIVIPNSTPAISIDNATLSYTENAAATQVDSAATLSDADGDADWNGGKLEVQITANAEAADEISIPDNVVGSINTSGTNILNGGTVIGTMSASEGTVTNGTKLTITFNANATNALVQQVLKAIHYRSTSENPGTSNRTITFTATDKNASSANDTRTVAVTAVNDAPTLTAFGTFVDTVAEDTEVEITRADLAAQGNEADVDGTVTAFVVKGVSTGTLRIGTTSVAATAWVATANDTVDASKSAYWTPPANASGTLNAFTVIAKDDGGAVSTGGNIQATVSVSAVNDPPVLTTRFSDPSTFNGDGTTDFFGTSVSGAGDVNNDGFDDFIVGARTDDNSGTDSGSARVLSGLDGSILYTFNGDSASDNFGCSVSGAGDVNNDGFADLIVGADGDDNNGSGSGSARVFSGQDGTILYTFNGDSAGDAFGCSVSGAGDVNNDGYADLIVGAKGDDNTGAESGSARIFSGQDGSILYTFDGDSAGDNLGCSVSGAGDVNNDGCADLIVGAAGDDNNGSGSGSARVFSGQSGSILYTFNGDSAGDAFGCSVHGAGDVNKDGFGDMVVGAFDDDNNGGGSGSARVFSGQTGSILYTFDGDAAGGNFGYSVSGAGDVNKDGFGDIVVGAYLYDGNGSNSGLARVLSGRDGSILYTFHGESAEDRFGFSVSGAGDLNKDGFDDIVVGAYLDDNNGTNSGSARTLKLTTVFFSLAGIDEDAGDDDGSGADGDDDSTANANNQGTTAGAIMASAGSSSDIEGATLGIAVIGADDTNGVWQYSLDGSAWSTLASASPAADSALLLNEDDLVRFVPAPDHNGTTNGSIHFKAWDKASGSAGDTAADTTAGNAWSVQWGIASISVSAIQDAPRLDNGGTMTLTSITEDATAPAGDTVAAIFASAGGDRITDPDSGAVEGIAVTGLTGDGTWQYDIGGGWTSVGGVAENSALLLTDASGLRFVPTLSNNNAQTATVTFRAWDRTAGSAETKVDVSINGGTTAFSTATETASCAVTSVNDAPSLDNTGVMNLTSISEDAAAPAGDMISAIIASAGGNRITDPDSGAVEGIAVTGLTGDGAWQYDTGGGWTAVGAVAANSALLLSDASGLRFVPTASNNNAQTATITFRAWDRSAGAEATKVDASASGGITAFSTATETASCAVTSVNDAPSLDNTGVMNLTSITEDATAPAGDLVSAVIASAGGDRITDVDSGALEGIAVTGVTGDGAWQYDIGGGWTAAGAVAANSALLLSDAAGLRFVPTASNNNAQTATVTFRAWDRSAGSQGTKVDASTNGGITAFSTAIETASCAVTSVNDAPILDNTGVMNLTPITEDATAPAGDLVSAFIAGAGGDRITDPDSGAVEGIAVTGLTGDGAWQYDTGGGWTAAGAVTGTSALLLTDAAGLRFLPTLSNNDAQTATVTFRAWDRSAGSQGTKVDTSANGGSTAFSASAESASCAVAAINDDPSITGLPTDVAFVEDVAGNVDLSGATLTDPDSGANDIVVTLTAGAGTMTASSGGGVTIGGSGTGTLTLSGTAANIDAYLDTPANVKYTGALNQNGDNATTLAVKANDGGNSGAGGGADIALGTVNLDITAVNDPASLAANTGVTVPEGLTATITTAMLNEGDPDDSGNELTYVVTAAPTKGILWLDGNGSGTFDGGEWVQQAGDTFTQSDIDVSHLRYTHDGSESISDSFGFSLEDGLEDGATKLTGQTFSITVTPVNDPPSLAVNSGAALSEGGTATVTTALLNEGDPDDSGTGLTFTVTTAPANGSLFIDGDGSGTVNGAESAIAASGTFTQADIDAGKLTYAHNGSETTSDGFVFTLSDGGEDGASALAGQTFAITVTPVNDPAAIATNTGLASFEGQTATVTTAMLNEGDPDDGGNELTYVVTAAPANGFLWLDGNGSGAFDGGEWVMTASDSFTQSDIDINHLKYTHSGSESISDSFGFSLEDGLEDGATKLTGQTFAITLTPVNDPPSVANLHGDALSYVMASGARIVNQGSGVSVTDVDSADFNGGSLTVSVAINKAASEDELSIDTNGAAGVSGTTAGSSVSVGGSVIGTLGNTVAAGADLVVTFTTPAATPANVAALMDAVTYRNTDTSTATENTRTVRFVVIDGDGTANGGADTSNASDATIEVSRNRAPSLTLSDTVLSYIENDGPVAIDPAAEASDIDGDSHWENGRLEAQITANAEAADELSIPDGLVGSINTDGTNLRNGATVIGTLGASVGTGSEGTVTGGARLTATFNANATNALVQQVARAISYRSTSENPGTSDRTIAMSVFDKFGGTSSDTRTIRVTAVNDPPEAGFGKALSLDGADDHAKAPSPWSTLDQTSTITLCAWVRPDFSTDPQWAWEIVSVADTTAAPGADGDDATDYLGFRISKEARRLQVGIDNGLPWTEAVSSGTIPEGTWSHAALVIDGTSVTFYINGIGSGTGTLQPRSLDGLDSVTIGAFNAAVGGAETDTKEDFFKGRIDEVQAWNRALTQAEVQSCMLKIPAGNEAGLSGCWRFTEGTGAVSADIAPGANQAVLVSGAAWADHGAIDLYATEDTAFTLASLPGFDPAEGSAVTFGLADDDSGAAAVTDPATGALTYTPAADLNGARAFTFTTSDGGLDSAPQAVTVHIAPVNDQPSVTAIGDQVMDEDGATGALALTVGDIDTPAEDLVVTASSSDTALVPNENIIFSGSGSSRTVTVTPSSNLNGAAVITITVTDPGADATPGTGDDLAATSQFTLSVNPVNDVPAFTKGSDQTVDEDAGAQTIAGWATGLFRGPADEAGQTLTFQVTSDNSALFGVQPALAVSQSDPATADLTFTPASDAHGTVTVSVAVKDNGGTANGGTDASAVQTFTITVNPVNDQPTLSGIPNPAAIDEDSGEQTVNLSGMGPGAAFESQELTVTAVSGNPALIPDPLVIYTSPGATGTLKYTPVANASGSATVTVTVTDAGLDGTPGTADDGTVSRQFTVTVNPVNDSPALDGMANPGAIDEDATEQTMNLSGIGTGAANEVQALAVTAVSGNTALIPDPTVTYASPDATGTLKYTPAANGSGTAVITVTVTDAGLDGTPGTVDDGTMSRQFRVTVDPVNDPPVLDASVEPALTPIYSGSTGHSGDAATVLLTGNYTDLEQTDPIGAVLTGSLLKDLSGAVVDAPGAPGGKWQFSSDNGQTWTDAAADDTGLTETSAVIVGVAYLIRFLPEPGYSGTASLSFRAWDGTLCSAGTRGIDASKHTPTGPCSAETGTALLAVHPRSLTLLPGSASIPENLSAQAGQASGMGTVTVPLALETDQLVYFSTDDPGRLGVTPFATVRKGQTSAAFELKPLDNLKADGSAAVTVTAFAEGWTSGSSKVTVTDDEIRSIGIVLAPEATEGAPGPKGAVRLSALTMEDLTVSLQSSSPARVQVPAAIVVPAGRDSAEFSIAVPDNDLLDGSALATVSASTDTGPGGAPTGWGTASATLRLADDEKATIGLTLPANLSENAGTIAGAGSVVLGGRAASAVTVNLASSDQTRLSLPPAVTVPAGFDRALFDITMIDNAVIDGEGTIRVLASATGFVSATGTVAVADDDAVTSLVITGPVDYTEGAAFAESLLVSLSPATEQKVVVSISVTPSELKGAALGLPASVVTGEGATTVALPVSVGNDDMINGTREVTVTATAPGYGTASKVLRIIDDEKLVLTVAVPEGAIEGDGALNGRGTVSIPGKLESSLSVTLTSADTTEVVLPETVEIPAGATQATFDLTVVDDRVTDGARTVTIWASAEGFVSGEDSITVFEAPAAEISPGLIGFGAADTRLTLAVMPNARAGSGTAAPRGPLNFDRIVVEIDRQYFTLYEALGSGAGRQLGLATDPFGRNLAAVDPAGVRKVLVDAATNTITFDLQAPAGISDSPGLRPVIIAITGQAAAEPPVDASGVSATQVKVSLVDTTSARSIAATAGDGDLGGTIATSSLGLNLKASAKPAVTLTKIESLPRELTVTPSDRSRTVTVFLQVPAIAGNLDAAMVSGEGFNHVRLSVPDALNAKLLSAALFTGVKAGDTVLAGGTDLAAGKDLNEIPSPGIRTYGLVDPVKVSADGGAILRLAFSVTPPAEAASSEFKAWLGYIDRTAADSSGIETQAIAGNANLDQGDGNLALLRIRAGTASPVISGLSIEDVPVTVDNVKATAQPAEVTVRYMARLKWFGHDPDSSYTTRLYWSLTMIEPANVLAELAKSSSALKPVSPEGITDNRRSASDLASGHDWVVSGLYDLPGVYSAGADPTALSSPIHLYAVAADAENAASISGVAMAETTMRLARPPAADMAPEGRITSPGDKTVQADASALISFRVADDGTDPVEAALLYCLSRDPGRVRNCLGADGMALSMSLVPGADIATAAEQTLTWDTTGLPHGYYSILLRVSDGRHQVVETWSEAAVGVVHETRTNLAPVFTWIAPAIDNLVPASSTRVTVSYRVSDEDGDGLQVKLYYNTINVMNDGMVLLADTIELNPEAQKSRQDVEFDLTGLKGGSYFVMAEVVEKGKGLAPVRVWTRVPVSVDRAMGMHDLVATVPAADPDSPGRFMVKVFFRTTVPALGRVEYGPNGLPVVQAFDEVDGLSHGITLSGLDPATAYWYRAVAETGSGDVMILDNGGNLYGFTTPAAAPAAVPGRWVKGRVADTMGSTVKIYVARIDGATEDFSEPMVVRTVGSASGGDGTFFLDLGGAIALGGTAGTLPAGTAMAPVNTDTARVEVILDDGRRAYVEGIALSAIETATTEQTAFELPEIWKAGDGIEVEASEIEVEMTLIKGYNLISLPLKPQGSLKAREMLQMIGDKAVIIAGYSPSRGSYDFMVRLGGSQFMGNNFTLDPTRGFFVKVTSDVAFKVRGEKMTRSMDVPVQKGFNLVAVPFGRHFPAVRSTGMTATEILSILGIDGLAVYAYEKGQYRFVVRTGTKADGTVQFYMSDGKDISITVGRSVFMKMLDDNSFKGE